MYQLKHETDPFYKAELTKALIRTHFGEELTTINIQRCLARIWHNRYHNSAITDFDRGIAKLLSEYKIEPKTAYTWIRTTHLPEDVRKLILKKKISPTKALEVIENRQRRERASLGLQILEKGRSLIQRL